MKRAISLIAVGLMLVPCVVLFSACEKEKKIETEYSDSMLAVYLNNNDRVYTVEDFPELNLREVTLNDFPLLNVRFYYLTLMIPGERRIQEACEILRQRPDIAEAMPVAKNGGSIC
jgi:hypothetical protein